MFGTLRTIFALMVMSCHLFGLRPIGGYAVFGFYIISGYLITLVMHESYGYSAAGRYYFAVNRFLRLYPMYWVATLFTVIIICFVGKDIVLAYLSDMFLPSSLKSIAENIFIVFPSWLPQSITPRLVPPTWVLTIELFFYFLICFGVSKSWLRVKVWFIISVAYVVISFQIGLPFLFRYASIQAASLPFSIGAGIYFCTKDKRLTDNFLNKSKLSSMFLMVLLIANSFMWTSADVLIRVSIVKEFGFYLNLLLCALLVYTLARGGSFININLTIDKIIGDLSYPIFLLHW